MLLCKKKVGIFLVLGGKFGIFHRISQFFAKPITTFAELWLETLVQRLEGRENCILDLRNDINSWHLASHSVE